MPAQLLQNRPDIRQAERELAAAGLDIRVARANFYPKLFITGGRGLRGLQPEVSVHQSGILDLQRRGDLAGPLINKAAIKADYMNANAEQLQAIYEYQRVMLNAFTEVINYVSKVQNYSTSLDIKGQQLQALEASVDIASKLFVNARVQYMDVLFAQRDLADARMVYIETKQQQLTAVVDTYQALGGGLAPNVPRRLPAVEGPEGIPGAPRDPGRNRNDPHAGTAPADDVEPLPMPVPKAVEPAAP